MAGHHHHHGSSSSLRMMILVIILFIISFYCAHTFIARSASFNGVYYNGNNNVDRLTTSPRFRKFLILEKVRVLLGVKSLSFTASGTGSSRTNQDSTHFSVSPFISPSPSQSPSPSPAPSSAVHMHPPAAHPPVHHHHHNRSLPTAKKVHEKDRGNKTKKILTAVLASAGVTSVLCAIGLFLGCWKFKKQRRNKRRKLSVVYRAEASGRGLSKFMSSQGSVKKVSSDPGPDLFYLNSLETALESEKCCMISMNNCSAGRSNEMGESGKKLLSSEPESVGCSSFGEITVVHEVSESFETERIFRQECDKFDDKVVVAGDDEEANSSDDDDESFHSVCDSHSSQLLRLSNASASSLGDESKETHCSRAGPPPPPPPPPQSRVLPPPPPAFSVTRMKSNLKSSSTLPNLSQNGSQVASFNPPKAPVAGIPPPPCPPPLLRGGSGGASGLKGPPPPPYQLTQQVPLGKDGSPLPKLKPLHWDKVRAAPDRSTVWDKLRSSSFEFDEEMIESLFGYNLQNQMKNEEAKGKTLSPGKHVLEPKRLQNITILSKALNVTAEQVCCALIRGDGLSLQDLEALSKMVPTKEEEAKLANYKGDVFELGSAEKLVKAMLKIPFAFSRIEAMLYREIFEDEVLHLRKSFSILEEACKELRSSRLFLKLLEAVLKTGNRMNVGTIRGGAKAFKLDALLKLADVKGTDGKTTLLHFVVQEIVRSEGLRVSESIMGKIHQKSKDANIEDKEEIYRKMGLDLVMGLGTELCNAKKTAAIDLDVLASSVANLSNGMMSVKDLVQNDMRMEENKGDFVSSMRSFLKHAETTLMDLREDEDKVLLHVREITEYFHGDVSKDESNPLRIFVIVRDFLSMLDNVCKELRSLKAPRTSPNPLAPFK